MKSYLLAAVRNSSERNLTWFSFLYKHYRADKNFFPVRVLVKNDATKGFRVICSFKITSQPFLRARETGGFYSE